MTSRHVNYKCVILKTTADLDWRQPFGSLEGLPYLRFERLGVAPVYAIRTLGKTDDGTMWLRTGREVHDQRKRQRPTFQILPCAENDEFSCRNLFDLKG